MTSLAALALLSADEEPDSPAIRKALEYLRRFGPGDLHSTYAISLQTMVYAAADPASDAGRIAANAEWLQEAQLKPGDPAKWPGSWGYAESHRARPGDNSNTQYALLGLQAASDVGVPIDPTVWQRARLYWELCQKRDGSWAYTPDSNIPTASMTCAGISSLVTTSAARGLDRGDEFLDNAVIHNCGAGGGDSHLKRGIDWLATHFQVDENFGAGKQWVFYYLYGLERAGRLAGVRNFGEHDWYHLGARKLVSEQQKDSWAWRGALVESDNVLSTSFALLFLAKGRAPMLINKLQFGPANDWNNDHDDISNLVGFVSRDWKTLLTWQTVNSRVATVWDLLRAPILYLSGHKAPEFSPEERANLRAYLGAGGTILAEACCGSGDFDEGFRKLMTELIPANQEGLRPLPADHPIWRARHRLTPEVYPLHGVRRAARTAVIYSPKDLSCYWNQAGRAPSNPAVLTAIKVGQNIVDYVTNRELPPDKLSDR
jgi:hypothetical protein